MKMRTGSSTYNQIHNILRYIMLYQIFLSTQVKRCAIINYKHGIYQLPQEFPSSRVLLAKMKLLLILEENSSKIKLVPLCTISHEN